MKNAPVSFKELTNNRSRLEIGGFRKQDAVVTKQIVYPPIGMDAAQWWMHFAARYQYALSERKFLGIYRASHGEFSFVTGLYEKPAGMLRRFRHYGSRMFYSVRFLSTFYSGSPGYGYETYRQWKLPGLRKHLASCLRDIGEDLVLCIYLSDRDAYPKYIQELFYNWSCKNGFQPTARNYGHIYFVYALFTGPNSAQIFRGKRILVITHLTLEKRTGIQASLRNRGAKSVEFVNISRSNAMCDRVALNTNVSPDLCIIGGGVGALNIIWQLKKLGLQCPCIDAGFVLDILSSRDFARRRIYCVNDEDWDQTYGGSTPEWAEKFADKYSYWPEVSNGEQR